MKLPKRGLLRTFAIPAHLLCVALHTLAGKVGFCPCRKTLHVIVGIVLILTGSFIAHLGAHAGNLLVTLLVDSLGYGIHGFGLAPIIKVAADLLGMEV